MKYDIEFGEVEKATWITAGYKDFDGDAENWRRAYFDLLAWKNTWGVPYRMDINSNEDHEAFLFMIVPEKRKEKTLEMLEDLGYRKVNATETTVVRFTNFEEKVDWMIED